MLSNKAQHIIRDFLIICASAAFAYLLTKSQAIPTLLEYDGNLKFLLAIIFGALFTTIFTIVPASVALVEMSSTIHPVTISILGGIGAMLIDSIIASFVRKDITRDLKGISRMSFKWHFISLFHFGFLKWLSFIVGLLVIASPLPDELGLFFIGISKVRGKYLPFVFFLANFLGIYILLSLAQKIG